MSRKLRYEPWFICIIVCMHIVVGVALAKIKDLHLMYCSLRYQHAVSSKWANTHTHTLVYFHAAPPTTSAPPKKCHSFCLASRHEWSHKCKFDDCEDCEECVSIKSKWHFCLAASASPLSRRVISRYLTYITSLVTSAPKNYRAFCCEKIATKILCPIKVHMRYHPQTLTLAYIAI